MKLFKNTSGKTLSVVLSVLVMISMLPIGVFTAFALTETALETTIAEQTFYTNAATEFTYTTVVSDEDAGKMVLGTFDIFDENNADARSAIDLLEYYDHETDAFYPFDKDFGPVDGFPFTNGIESRFRATFNKAGTYKVVASMINPSDRSVIVSKEETIVVTPYDSELTTDIDTKTFINGVETEFTYTTFANAFKNEMVLGTFSVVDGEGNDAQASIAKLEYFDVTTSSYMPFYGDFGPAGTGFPLGDDITSNFRVTFCKAGTYTVNAAIKRVSDGSVLCTNTKTITVQPNQAVLTTDIASKIFEINSQVDFTYTTIANDYLGTYVLGTFVLEKDGADAKDSVLSLQYYDVTTSSYKEFYGDFGPAGTGFPLGNNITSDFRATFKDCGTYKVTAQIVKASDREVLAESVTTIEVKDTLKPVITEVTGNPVVWVGSDVTLSVVATDNSGSVAQYSMDNVTWQSSNQFAITENGTYTFYAKDAAGNVSEASAPVEVKFIDKTAPVFGVVSFDPDEWKNVVANIAVTIPATDEGVGKILYSVDGGEWQESNIFTVANNGTHTFRIKDSVGNENAEPLEIGPIKYDVTAPVINSITPSTTEWVSDKVTLTIDAEDEGVKCIAYKLNDGEWQSENTFEVTENGSYSIYVKDCLGNEIAEAKTIEITNIDKTKPEILDFTSTTENWINTNVTISGTVKEEQSGLAKLEYKIGNGEWLPLEVDADNKFTLTIEEECNTTYTFRCTDNVNNESSEYVKAVKIDKTAPAVQLADVSDIWRNEQLEITGVASDEGSGIESAIYTNNKADEGNLTFIGNDILFETAVTASGAYTYVVTVTDAAGNITNVDVLVKFDFENPEISINQPEAWVNIAVSEEITATDVLSDIVRVYYKEAGVENALEVDIQINEGKYILNLPAEDNNKKYEIYCVDGAGNTEKTEYTAKIDVTAPDKPVITYTKALGYKVLEAITFGLYNAPVTVTITATDALSGIKAIEYYIGDQKTVATPDAKGEVVFTIDPDVQNKISAIAHDNAGNNSDEKTVGSDGEQVDIGGVIVDATKPVIVDDVTYNANWTNDDVVVTGSVSDNLAGVEKVYWKQGENGTENEATLNDDGTYTFTIPKQDYNGLIYIICYDYTQNSIQKEIEVKMDVTAPDVIKTDDSPIIYKAEWTNGNVVVTGSVFDNLAGVVKVYWKQGLNGVENDDVTLNDDGTYTFTIPAQNYEGLIYIGCYDAAQNKAEETIAVQMDTTSPEVKDDMVYNAEWTNGNVVVTGSVSDNLAGVVKVYWKQGLNGVENDDVTLNDDGTYTFTIPATNYEGLVNIWCEDDAGNESAIKTATVRMDTTIPKVTTGTAESAEWTNENVIISGELAIEMVNNAAAPIVAVKYSYNEGEELDGNLIATETETGIAYTYSLVIPRQDYKGNVTVWCIDDADNVSDEYNVSVKMDVSAPADVEIIYTESVISKLINTITFGFYSTNEPLNVIIKAKDNLSLEKIEYTVTGYEGVYSLDDASFSGSENVTADGYNEAGDVISGYITFNVPAEFKGKINAVAYDNAGNSTFQNENNKNYDEVIVDSIAPDIDISYAANDENTKAQFVNADNATVDNFNKGVQVLYNGDATATITVKETNFVEGEMYTDENGLYIGKTVHELGILVTKTDNDGNVTYIEYLPADSEQLFAEATQTVEFEWESVGNVHKTTIPYDEDADYVITVKYADFSENEAEITANDGVNAENTYVSKVVTIDKTAPVVDVVYSNIDVKATMDSRDYLIADQFATITVTEHNFRADDFKATVLAKYSDATDVVVEDFASTLADDSKWTKNGNVYTINLNYVIDANYTFDYTYEDLAHNQAAEYEADVFTVDKVNPEAPTVTYDGDVKTTIVDKILNVITFGYYDAKVKVTITADDAVAGVDHFIYSYTNAEGVSSVNASLENVVIENSDVTRDGKTFSATFEIPKDVLQISNQFNGTVDFTAVDRATRSTSHNETATIIVDNIKPVSTVTYSEPIQIANEVSYYAGEIFATVVIDEANFYSEDVNIVVTKDGVPYPVNVMWVDNSVDIHTGTFTLSEDGDYIVSVNYLDRSKNEMVPYTSNQLTIDTKDPVISISNISHQSANNGETISFTVSVTDTNIPLDGFKPTLEVVVKTMNEDGEYVYETQRISLGGASTSVNAAGETVYTYTVSNLDADGFYSLSCTALDYANHSVSTINAPAAQGSSTTVGTVNFSVNREGSVFWIETEPKELNGSYWNGDVKVVLHEVNVDPIDEDADKKTEFTLNDGSKPKDIELIEGTNYTKNTQVGNGGWYETVYTLNNDVFDHDGVYSLNVITYDKAENSNINTKSEAGSLSFTLDRTAPVISANITNGQTVDDTQFWVEFEITDANLNPDTVKVKVNGTELDKEKVEDLGNNEYRFLVESGYNYTIEITATDLAKNESAECVFEEFTVSTNILILWYANTPLFWGSIGGAVALAGAIAAFILLSKKKKAKKNS